MYVFEKKTAKWMFLKIDIAYLYVVIINNLFIVTVLSLFIKRTHVKLLSLVMGRIYEIINNCDIFSSASLEGSLLLLQKRVYP